jgi:hypothetical protein
MRPSLREIVLGVLVVVSISMNVVLWANRDDSGESDSNDNIAGDQDVSTIDVQPTLEPIGTLPLGATVAIGTIKLNVERAFKIDSEAASQQSETWIGVEGSAENGGDQNFPIVAAQHFAVRDRDGVVHAVSFEAIDESRSLGLSRRQEWTAEIIPETVVKGLVAFELPQDCSGSVFVVVGLSREASWSLDAVCGPSE